MFAFGKPIHDPLGLARRCQHSLRQWYDQHPGIVAAWDRQQAKWDRRKVDPDYPLDFPTQREFCEHLVSLCSEEDQQGSGE
jgi:hypothetical protein